jgi:hypothetical protein
MDFRDEIVPLGQVDQFGVPITGNARKSTHRGVELEWSARRGWLELTGNLTLSENVFDEYFEHVDSVTVNDYSGNSIAAFRTGSPTSPSPIVRAACTAGSRWSRAVAQYLDNTEDNRHETPHFVRRPATRTGSSKSTPF